MTAPTPLLIRLGIWAWLIAALFTGHFQWLRPVGGAALQLILLGLAAALLAAYHRRSVLRAWIDGLDLRALVLLHLTRFVGFFFLVLHERGALPHAFAVPAGWGDIVTASLALLVCFVPMAEVQRLRAINLWNMIGLADLLLMVLAGVRLGLADPAQLWALGVLPLSLVPTFLGPLLLATHVIIHLRVRDALAPGTRHAA